MRSYKRGVTVAAVVTGTGGTRLFTFDKETSPCYFTNRHTVSAYVKINAVTGASTAHGTFDVVVPAEATWGTPTLEASLGREIAVKSLHVFWASDPGVAYSVTGFPASQ